MNKGFKAADSKLEHFTEKADKQAKDVAAKLGKSLSAVGQVATRAGVALTAGLTAPLVAALDKGVRGAMDLEKAVANISTIKPQIDTKAVFDSLNQMQTRVPQTADQLGAALYDVFSSVEIGQRDALRLVESFAKGATGAMTDTQTFGTAVMGVMNAYRLDVAGAQKVSDLFFATVNKGVITGQELASSLGPVTQAAKTAGLSIEMLTAAIAAVTKEGGPAAQNVNNLNNLLQKITTTEAMKNMAELGVKAVDSAGKFRPLTAILTDLKAKLSTMNQSKAAAALQDIFPDMQARQGALTLMSQLDFLKQTLKENENAAGTTDAAFKKMDATMDAAAKRAQNTISAGLTQIGQVALPMIAKAMDAVMPRIMAFFQWFDRLPDGAQQSVLVFGGVAAALGPLLILFGQLASAVGTVVTLFSAGGALAGVGAGIAAVLTGPVGLAIAAIAAAVVALKLAWDNNFLGMRDGIQEFITWLAPFVGDGLKALQSFWNEIMGQVVAWTMENLPLIQKTWATLSADVMAVVGPLLAYVRQIFGAIAAFLREHGDEIRSILAHAWEVVKAVVGTTIGTILGLLKAAMQAFTGDWRGAWETVKQIVVNIIRGIHTAVMNMGASLFEAGKMAVQGLIDGIKANAAGVLNATTEIAKNIPRAVEKHLDIRSPSRVMRQIGEDVTEGFAQGILSGVARLVTIGTAMALAVQSGFAAPQLRPGESFTAYIDRQTEALDKFNARLGEVRTRIAELNDPKGKRRADSLGIDLSLMRQMGPKALGKLEADQKVLATKLALEAGLTAPRIRKGESVGEYVERQGAALDRFRAKLRELGADVREAMDPKGKKMADWLGLSVDDMKLIGPGQIQKLQAARMQAAFANGEIGLPLRAPTGNRRHTGDASEVGAAVARSTPSGDLSAVLAVSPMGAMIAQAGQAANFALERLAEGRKGYEVDMRSITDRLMLATGQTNEYTLRLRELTAQYGNAAMAKRVLDEGLKAEKAEEFAYKIRGVSNSVAQSLSTMLMQGTASIQGLHDLFARVTQSIGQGFLTDWLGGALKPRGKTDFSPLAGLAGFGRREHGGPVTAGEAYIVGEKRPELFVPDESGYILPRVPGRSAASTAPNITVNQVFNIAAPNGTMGQQAAAQVRAEAMAGLMEAYRRTR
ncbi:MAG: phage tail tape measure protein [Fimbriimonas sp.]